MDRAVPAEAPYRLSCLIIRSFQDVRPATAGKAAG
jgi:hypothetical protein